VKRRQKRSVAELDEIQRIANDTFCYTKPCNMLTIRAGEEQEDTKEKRSLLKMLLLVLNNSISIISSF
jgi:hypothetical protein